MSEETFGLILTILPLLVGGLIAAVNARQVNDVTEAAEGRVRGWQSRTSARRGRLSKWVANPLLWAIVKFCDWTDGFAHRGLKNGARVAVTLYLIGLWLLILYVAVIVVIGIVICLVVLYIVARVLGGSDARSTSSPPRPTRREDDEVIDHVGLRGKNVYAGTNWFNEELKGRVDADGNLYRGTSWINEEKIGRVDEDGSIYKGTNWMNEVKVGRIDKDGTLYKGSNWFTEERTGRVDQDGTIHKGRNWLDEERRGRTGE